MTDLYLLGAFYLLALAACLWWAWRWRHQHAATMRDFARDCFPPDSRIVDLEAYRRAQLEALVRASNRGSEYQPLPLPRPQPIRRVH